MQVYDAPLRDMRFVLHELHGLERITALPAYADATADVVDGILDEAARLTTEVILPLNASGDLEGCTLENGVVRTPAGFREAYDTFRAGGWPSLAGDPEFGGQGLPECVNKLVEEMICGANLSFSLYPGLTHGAVKALESHGSPELKAMFLSKLTEGTWAGAMALTEAQCGTDLGLMRTRAVPDDAGAYRLSGSKIFISAGDHDLTENIVHLVLARLPDAPPGVKGISMFLVPKLLPTEDGRPGARNGVVCTGLEHKMGLKASATCQITYEDAKGWLVGAPHRGMQAMFTMMNEERLGVGIQGLGVASVAYQSAAIYAKDRIQGRSLSGTKRPDLPADPIIVHPDVRRMLMTMRVNAEACRAVGIWVAQAVDLSKHAATPAERREAEDFTALMTPVVKALFTDIGYEMASLGVQVYGGHGYIRDHGMEQFVRDARIAMLYEGTNGIQALDLVGRKMPAHMGRLLRPFFHPIADYIEAKKGHAAVAPLVLALERAFGMLQLATGQIAAASLKDPEEAGAAATDYLRLLGLVAMSYMLTRSAEIAAARVEARQDADGFYAAKLASARFFTDRVLPQTASLYLAIKSGKASTMAMAEADFIERDHRPPEGFRALGMTPERAEGYNPIVFHARRIGLALALGFRVGPEHLNPGGRCHGGVLASFCDMHLAFAIMFETPALATTILPTINLSLDYLAAVRLGVWVEGVGGVVSVTRNFAVAQSVVTADGVPAVRTSGIYKVGGARVTGIDTGAWLRAQVDQPAA